MYINKVQIMGRIGLDPKFFLKEEDKKMCTFSVATSSFFLNKKTGEKEQKTEWHNVVVYNKFLVEKVEKFLKKGSRVYLEGSLKTDEYINDNKQKIHTTKIVLNNFYSNLIVIDYEKTEKTEEVEKAEKVKKVENQENFSYEIDDEIPF